MVHGEKAAAKGVLGVPPEVTLLAAEPPDAPTGAPTGGTEVPALLARIQLWLQILAAAGVGYIIRWGLDQWSLRATARREFAQVVTGQISNLASEHYWSLANYAGLVAGLLEEYLQDRSYHLIVMWDNKADLKNRIDEIAENTTKTCFPYFCHLIGLFDDFQFKESNTYLLTDHQAGETCKRLYNTFVHSFPDQLRLQLANLYALEISDSDSVVSGSEADKAPKELKRISDIPPVYLEKTIQQHLQTEKELWYDWLRRDIAGVIQAADALRAYNELLNHELANLYRDWFQRETPTLPYVDDIVFSRWPNVLTEQSLMAIGQTRQKPTLLSPLGYGISEVPTLLKQRPGPAQQADGQQAPQVQAQETLLNPDQKVPPEKSAPPPLSAEVGN